MRASSGPLRRAACALVLWSIGPIAPATAAPVLRSAQVTITVPSPGSCNVSMTLVVEGGTAIDHRLEMPPGASVDALRVSGARQAAEPRDVGRTRSLVLTPDQSPYTLSYAAHDPARPDRCLLWLPTVPADGVSRAVRLQVELPAGMTPGNTMPRLTWNGATGTATLAHLPAFVLVPYVAPGESPGWNVSTAMDAAAVSVFVGASAIWVWRRRGRQGRWGG